MVIRYVIINKYKVTKLDLIAYNGVFYNLISFPDELSCEKISSISSIPFQASSESEDARPSRKLLKH